MDIFSFLSYLNKISLLAFIVTLGFLIYQFYLLKKESIVNKNKTPIIPDFNENEKIDVLNYTKLPNNLNLEHQTVIRKDNNKQIVTFIVGAGLLVLTLGVFIILRSKQTNKIEQVSEIVEPTPTLKPVVLISKQPTIKFLITITPTPTKKILSSASLTPSPTEVVIALLSPTAKPLISESSENLTPTSTIFNLPVSGVIDQSLIFFAGAVSLILFAFIF